MVFFVLGRVCVPIDPKRCEEFDPTTVPTLSQVNSFCNDSFLICIPGREKLSKTVLSSMGMFVFTTSDLELA